MGTELSNLRRPTRICVFLRRILRSFEQAGVRWTVRDSHWAIGTWVLVLLGGLHTFDRRISGTGHSNTISRRRSPRVRSVENWSLSVLSPISKTDLPSAVLSTCFPPALGRKLLNAR